jgi:hypothetical protein
VGLSECAIRLFTIEATLDQILGNRCHFFKPIHRIKNLLTVKWLLNVVSYFIIIFLSGQTAVLKNAYYRVGQGTLGMRLWNQGGGGPKKFANHCSKLLISFVSCGVKSVVTAANEIL